MTEEKSKTGPERRKAIRAWASRVRAAGRALQDEALTAREIDALRTISRIVYGLEAQAVGVSDGVVERRLKRIVAAGMPRIGEGVALAHRLIVMHAERKAPLTGGMNDADLAVMLCSALTSNVHEAFGKLKPEMVVPLLARYTRTKDRTKLKITAAGILVELNRAARWPLGKALKAGGVGNAVRRNPV